MNLVTCYKEDCPNPHFYVDPKGGKISISDGVDGSGIQFAMQKAQGVNVILKEADGEAESLTPDGISLLKQFTQALDEETEATPNKTKKPLVEKVKKTKDGKVVNDYMVAYCDENHKNYIPYHNPKKYKREQEEQQNN